MQTRKIGQFEVSEIGLGCMNLSHAYGTPPDEKTAIDLLNRALDLGCTMLDTAALYGFGNNEALLKKAVMHRRGEFLLATKGGMFKNDAGVREINGHPDALRKNCEGSLQRLGTDVIDLYYLHRWDKNVPIEESIGALSNLVSEGKILTIGLSEASAATLSKAHAVHPIAAMQTEYSLWTRNPEISVLDKCKELGTAFVAFSPLARGFLTGKLQDVSLLEEKDIRRGMPRFEAENYTNNLKLLSGLQSLAEETSCTMGQLSLAWLLTKAPHIIPIPGTTSISHLEENLAASQLTMSKDTINKLECLINQGNVHGRRYNSATQAEIDTEEYSH